MLRSAAILLPALLSTSCVISINGWDEYDFQHDESLEVGPWSDHGVVVESAFGDIRIEPTAGPNTIVVTLHEKHAGDARASFEDGHLVVTTASGDGSAVGNVLILSNGPLPSARIKSGMGDVELVGVPVEGRIELFTGMGDVLLQDTSTPGRVTMATGMGEVTVRNVECDRIEAASGMGDVDAAWLTADKAELSSGLGDVDIVDCSFGRLEADTGLGDIDCARTTYAHIDLDSGLGSVSTD
ncbi:MAG: DUF4097 family beta strand repeat-containing protein [Planctomycetota bacterium]|nr:DUF4097 family beta strand repeat-containing protein [Planctomycetota bacterium]